MAGLLLVAGAAAAEDMPRMDRAACDAGFWALYERFVPHVPGGENPFTGLAHTLSPEGWCRLTSAMPELAGTGVETIDWRAAIGPEGLLQRLEIRTDLAGILDPLIGPGRAQSPQIDVAVTYDVDANAIELDRLKVDFGMLGAVEVTAIVTGLDLTTPVSSQLSIGSMRLVSGRIDAALTGLVDRAILPAVMDNQPPGTVQSAMLAEFREDAAAALAAFAPEVLDAPSRGEMMAAFDALPQARGRLEVVLDGRPGIGWLTLSRFFEGRQRARFGMDQGSRAQWDFLLSQSAIRVDWQPE